MEFHQAVAICIVIAMAFVIDSTVKLFRYRRRSQISAMRGPLRDIQILRRPNDFEMEETRLTYKNWLSCAAMLALMILFLLTSPDSLRAPNAGADPNAGAAEQAPVSGASGGSGG